MHQPPGRRLQGQPAGGRRRGRFQAHARTCSLGQDPSLGSVGFAGPHAPSLSWTDSKTAKDGAFNARGLASHRPAITKIAPAH